MLQLFFRRFPLAMAVEAAIVFVAAVPACSSSSTAPSPFAAATCADAGAAVVGPDDMHCQGVPVQAVNEASCFIDAAGTPLPGSLDAAVAAPGDDGGDDGGAAANECDFGATMFGREGKDDDCKYLVTWTSTPICEGSLGVTFTATVTNLTTMLPVTDVPAGEGLIVEAFIPDSLDASCDDMSMHGSPGGTPLFQTTSTSGVYTGRVIFDAPGEWTVRFHIHEECADLLPDSPHGHAAFHIHVP